MTSTKLFVVVSVCEGDNNWIARVAIRCFRDVFVFVLLGIFLAGAVQGYWIVRKFVISEDGSVDVGIAQFVKWAMRVIAATFIFQSTLDTRLAMGALVSCLAIYLFITLFKWNGPNRTSDLVEDNLTYPTRPNYLYLSLQAMIAAISLLHVLDSNLEDEPPLNFDLRLRFFVVLGSTSLFKPCDLICKLNSDLRRPLYTKLGFATCNFSRGCRGDRGRCHALNLDEEIEMNSSIERNNDKQNQRNEIEELSSQLATLVGKVQCLSLLSNGSNGSKDHQRDDSFDAPHRRRAYSHSFDSRLNDTVKDLVFLEFHGSYYLDVFEEWLNTIESHLKSYDVTEARKSGGVLEEKECFVDEASLALTLLPMKEVVAIHFLDSKELMVESHEVEASWVLDDLCFREMPLVLSSKPFVPLCVDLVPGLVS
ncbi:hypothetical protein TEA_018186 [Camellia sinensis var. sinensis]|uniref:Uncharacterized protein n=1 Tax=Camellia sinensis var. sinensis TaxID=542762 RepID=A0A4S4D2B5_CAMSN|nr:hypothetical protein TEA_018186 [Camellia sinensis var. sinensis]